MNEFSRTKLRSGLVLTASIITCALTFTGCSGQNDATANGEELVQETPNDETPAIHSSNPSVDLSEYADIDACDYLRPSDAKLVLDQSSEPISVDSNFECWLGEPLNGLQYHVAAETQGWTIEDEKNIHLNTHIRNGEYVNSAGEKVEAAPGMQGQVNSDMNEGQWVEQPALVGLGEGSVLLTRQSVGGLGSEFSSAIVIWKQGVVRTLYSIKSDTTDTEMLADRILAAANEIYIREQATNGSSASSSPTQFSEESSETTDQNSYADTIGFDICDYLTQERASKILATKASIDGTLYGSNCDYGVKLGDSYDPGEEVHIAVELGMPSEWSVQDEIENYSFPGSPLPITTPVSGLGPNAVTILEKDPSMGIGASTYSIAVIWKSVYVQKLTVSTYQNPEEKLQKAIEVARKIYSQQQESPLPSMG